MRRFLVLGALCASTVAFAQQPKLPDWFPAQAEFSVGGGLVHYDYGEETFKDAKGDDLKVRGKTWESGADSTDAQVDAGTPWNPQRVFAAIMTGLKTQGFVVDYQEAPPEMTASLRKGRGNGATYVWVSLSTIDSSSDQMLDRAGRAADQDADARAAGRHAREGRRQRELPVPPADGGHDADGHRP